MINFLYLIRLSITNLSIEAAHMWLGRDSSVLWFETFDLISKNGLVALDSNLKEKVTTKGECLGAIYKSRVNADFPSFILTSWDCKEKKSAVCEKEPRKFHSANTGKPDFPCIPQNRKTRNKRQDSMLGFGTDPNIDSSGQNSENGGSDPPILGPFDSNEPKNPAWTGADGLAGDLNNLETDESSGKGILFHNFDENFNLIQNNSGLLPKLLKILLYVMKQMKYPLK